MSFQGPFPSVDAGSILQERSIRALKAALPLADFLFRDERSDDYGVDGSIELRLDGYALNIRAQVQLKGRSNTHVNAAGAVAVRVDTMNLNYLLNGICPIYVLYRPEADELRFAYARDEWARLERENVNWLEQETNTLYFHHVLTSDTLSSLRRAIAAEASLRRQVDERLARIGSAAGHRVHVDAATLEVTDSAEACEMLVEQGIALTNSGKAKVVVERGRLVGASALVRTPRAALAVVYAHYHLSNYYDASAAIRQLLLSRPILEEGHRALLDALFVSVRRMLGEIDDGQYEKEMAAWRSNAPPSLGVQYDISRAWAAYCLSLAGSLDPKEHAKARNGVRSALRAGREQRDQLLLEYIQLLDLTLAAHEVSDLVHEAAALDDIASHGAGDTYVARVAARQAQVAEREWEANLQSLLRATRGSNIRVWCEARILKDARRLEVERRQRYLARSQGDEFISDAMSALVAGARETLEIARALEDRHLELTSMLRLAETLDTQADVEQATALALQVQEIAQLTGSSLHLRQARQFLSGEDRFQARLREIDKMRETSEEELLAAMPEEQLHHTATLIAAANGLPQGRVSNILLGLRCRRQIETERKEWCRHIVLAQRQRDNESQLTMHMDPPLLKVQCMKLHVGTLVRSPTPSRVSKEFRDTHCRGCAHRDPASGPSLSAADDGERTRRLRNKKKKQRYGGKTG